MDKTNLSRREILRTSIVGATGILVAVGHQARAAIDSCKLTPAQMEGPFYPEKDLQRDSDLTQFDDQSPVAEGQMIYLTGKVTNTKCEPLENSLVEIWQAAASGKYNHSGDVNPLELDPHFQYWGRARTVKDGSFLFKTIIPGHYPVGGGRFRPPHIHFKVHARHHVSLTTQLYFHPQSYDDLELAKVVDQLNRAEGVDPRLMVLFEKVGTGFGQAEKRGNFDIVLKSL